jgi:ribosomal protein L29
MTREAQELRLQSTEELNALKDAKKAEIFEIKSAFASRNEDAKLSKLRASRKTIARILTILHERGRGLRP